MTQPEITRCGLLDMQVCVPAEFSDEDVRRFAEQHNPCGTTAGWQIRREGDERLDGAPERVECESRQGFVHVMLEA